MIQKLYIKDLKCFNELEIELSNLNLLVGTNSSGKSSVIQSILLILHNISNNGNSPLNGKVISLGDFKEVANYINNAKEFSVAVEENTNTLKLVFNENKVSISKSHQSLIDKFNLINKKIKYIPANRIGYENLYLKSYDEFDEIGNNAEFVFNYYENNKDKSINTSLLIDDIQTLEYNVDYWLKKILNAHIKTRSIEKTDNVRAEYSYNTHDFYVRPKNIGSGISYMVSVLVTCLLANENDLVIIENPEIHLHPKAQSVLSDFFVFVAKAGVQLIIETHSDHIFNGVRKSVNKFSKNKELFNSLNKELAKIHFFIMNDKTLQSEHTEIILNDLGGITNYQKLLFDQFDDDLDEFLNI